MLPVFQLYELVFGSMFVVFLAVVAVPVLAIAVVLARWTRMGTQLGLLRRRLGMSRPLGWAVGLAMLGGFLLPFVVGDPPVDEPGELWFVVAGVLHLGGIFVAGWALARRDHLRLIRETPTTETGSTLQPGDLVELEGEAAPAEETLTAPVTGEPCIAYRYRVEDRRWAGRHHTWVTVDHGRGSVPLTVDDGTGRAYVDPQGARLELHDVEVVTVDDDEQPPEPVRELNESVPAVDDGDRARYREWRLDPGETAYVLGVVEDYPTADDLGRTVVADGSGPFIVADRGEEKLKRSLRLLVVYGGPGGAVAAVAGMWWMLRLAGAL